MEYRPITDDEFEELKQKLSEEQGLTPPRDPGSLEDEVGPLPGSGDESIRQPKDDLYNIFDVNSLVLKDIMKRRGIGKPATKQTISGPGKTLLPNEIPQPPGKTNPDVLSYVLKKRGKGGDTQDDGGSDLLGKAALEQLKQQHRLELEAAKQKNDPMALEALRQRHRLEMQAMKGGKGSNVVQKGQGTRTDHPYTDPMELERLRQAGRMDLQDARNAGKYPPAGRPSTNKMGGKQAGNVVSRPYTDPMELERLKQQGRLDLQGMKGQKSPLQKNAQKSAGDNGDDLDYGTDPYALEDQRASNREDLEALKQQHRLELQALKPGPQGRPDPAELEALRQKHRLELQALRQAGKGSSAKSGALGKNSPKTPFDPLELENLRSDNRSSLEAQKAQSRLELEKLKAGLRPEKSAGGKAGAAGGKTPFDYEIPLEGATGKRPERPAAVSADAFLEDMPRQMELQRQMMDLGNESVRSNRLAAQLGDATSGLTYAIAGVRRPNDNFYKEAYDAADMDQKQIMQGLKGQNDRSKLIQSYLLRKQQQEQAAKRIAIGAARAGVEETPDGFKLTDQAVRQKELKGLTDLKYSMPKDARFGSPLGRAAMRRSAELLGLIPEEPKSPDQPQLMPGREPQGDDYKMVQGPLDPRLMRDYKVDDMFRLDKDGNLVDSKEINRLKRRGEKLEDEGRKNNEWDRRLGKGIAMRGKEFDRREKIKQGLRQEAAALKAKMSGGGGGKMTEYQGKAAGFALRMNQAEQDFMDITDKGYDPKNSGNQNWKKLIRVKGLGYIAKLALPVPEDVIRQAQAEDNFLNATLRQESGAAISQGEYEVGDKQYFPQPNDPPEVLEQKRRNRIAVMSAMQTIAGAPLMKKIDETYKKNIKKRKTVRAEGIEVPAFDSNDGMPDFDNMSLEELRRYNGK